MTYRLLIREVVPWTGYNEHEAEIHGELDGVPVCCHTVFGSSEDWERARVGSLVEAEVWLERSGGIELAMDGAPAAFEQTAGVNYEVRGAITALDDEGFEVDCAPSMRVEPRPDQPPLRIGAAVRVRGVLEVDLG